MILRGIFGVIGVFATVIFLSQTMAPYYDVQDNESDPIESIHYQNGITPLRGDSMMVYFDYDSPAYDAYIVDRESDEVFGHDKRQSDFFKFHPIPDDIQNYRLEVYTREGELIDSEELPRRTDRILWR